MADESDTLTMDEALTIDLADDGSPSLTRMRPSLDTSWPSENTALAAIPDEGETDLPPEDRHSLTMEEAARIDFEDGPEMATVPNAVAVIDGKELTVTDLVHGYEAGRRFEFNEARLAVESRAVTQAADRVAAAAWQLSDLMLRQVAPEPDMALLAQDQGRYLHMQALHEMVKEHASKALQLGQAAMDAAEVMGQQQAAYHLDVEEQALQTVFPETADPDTREQFMARIRDVAHECGFTDNEFMAVTDHRVFRLAYLAALTMEHQRKQRMVPRQKKRRRQQRHSDAMERLIQSGRMEDAIAVDFV